MKLKYYMRGLGIGIVVTALLMGFAISKQKEPMTDEEIKQRALEMGMIAQDGVLADDLGDQMPEEIIAEVSDNDAEAEMMSEAATTDEEIAVGEDETSAITDSVEEEETTEENKPADDETDEDAMEEVAVEGFVVITVSGGDGSRTVANKLQEAGLIEDAAAYDVFLCQNGYDKRIATGNHEIPMGATEEEIAKEITTRKN